MKKIYSIILALGLVHPLSAQYKLSGSSYTQNFDTLVAGLPAGWSVDTNATTTSSGGSAAGTFIASPATNTRWGNVSGAFKNVASANSFATFAAATNAAQLAATDRALAVKQTGTFGDAGAAFVFQIDNTYGLSDFELDLKVQSLDSSGGSRISPWQVQYAFGDEPKIFTTVSAFSTGGNTYKNLMVNVPFHAALDDKREKVWIRIVALTASSGTGSRTTTAIDDVQLSWTGTAIPGHRPLTQKLFPANGITEVPLGSILAINFSKKINIGSGNIYIKNETDNTTQIISAGSAFLNVVGKQLLISGVKLAHAKSYHVTFDSTIVDTASVTAYALTDTTEWSFKTTGTDPYFIVEVFDTACVKSGSLPSGWSKFSKSGAQEWNCFEHVPGNSSMRMYGNDGASNVENEDWLISQRMDLSSPDALAVSFRLYKSYSGNELQVLLSHDYVGSGTPDSATWTPVSLIRGMSATDTGKWFDYTFPLTFSDKASPFRLGFKYTSSITAAYDIRLDTVMAMIKTGVKEWKQNQSSFVITGYPSSNKIDLLINSQTAGVAMLQAFNSMGQIVYTKALYLVSGQQNISLEDINFPSGMYVIRLLNGKEQSLQKCIVR